MSEPDPSSFSPEVPELSGAVESSEPVGVEDPQEEGSKQRRSSWKLKWLVGLSVVAAALLFYWQFGEWLSLERLAAHEQQLLAFRDQYWFWVLVAAFLFYVAVTGASLPGAAVLSLVYAWFLGFWPALFLISFASTLGATLALLLSRYLFRDWVQRRFGQRWQSFDANLQREGAFYLFTLRLIPSIPFFVINLAMGPTRIPVRQFWWVSQVGMLPGTIALVWAGSAAPNLQELAERGVSGILTWPLLGSFVFLSTVPWLARGFVRWWRSSHASLPDETGTAQ